MPDNDGIRVGRPNKVDGGRDVNINFRLSQGERARFNAVCQRERKSQSDFVMWVVAQMEAIQLEGSGQ